MYYNSDLAVCTVNTADLKACLPSGAPCRPLWNFAGFRELCYQVSSCGKQLGLLCGPWMEMTMVYRYKGGLKALNIHHVLGESAILSLMEYKPIIYKTLKALKSHYNQPQVLKLTHWVSGFIDEQILTLFLLVLSDILP